MKAISLYSGPGGSSSGLKMAGIEDIVGVEWDDEAVATARAAGFMVHHGDVRELDPLDFYEEYLYDPMEPLLHSLFLQASPPCQGLSMAGKGIGREDLIHLFESLERLIEAARNGANIATLRRLQREESARLVEVCAEERSPLTFEVVRWIVELIPEHIMFEQVPAALPIWEKIAELLKAMGYAVWTGNIHAEQFGVPQTRKRAILLASNRAMEVTAPVPTHSKYHNRTPDRLDEGVRPWISMAEALGWGARRPASRPTHMGDVVQKNGTVRSIHQPSPTLTASMDNGNWRWVVDEEALLAEVEPRVHNQSGTEFDLTWPAHRPAPVIAGRDIVTMPGANANRFNGSTKSRNDGIKVTVEEAGVLQSFPVNYPWKGNKTKKFEQVGNAVPPVLQAAVTIHLLECASESIVRTAEKETA